MRRTSLLLAATLLGLSSSLIAGTLSGGVNLEEGGGTALYSYGWAEYFVNVFEVSYGEQFEGKHIISQGGPAGLIAFATVGPTRQYEAYISGNGYYGLCYRGQLEVHMSPPYPSNSFGSGQICVSAPPPPPPEDCSGGGGPLPTSMSLAAPAPVLLGAGGCGNSPIVFDLDGNGFELTGPDNPVLFDIDGNGLAERITWTAPGSNVVFLALDRNTNGKIDSGRELFGDSTLLTTGGTAKNGYIALAEFDRPDLGGNGDGAIGPEDAIWPRLRLWNDVNHNGKTERNELTTLEDARIVRIGFDYETIRKRDRYGNLFRFRGKAWRQNRAGRPKEIASYDVFFVRLP